MPACRDIAGPAGHGQRLLSLQRQGAQQQEPSRPTGLLGGGCPLAKSRPLLAPSPPSEEDTPWPLSPCAAASSSGTAQQQRALDAHQALCLAPAAEQTWSARCRPQRHHPDLLPEADNHSVRVLDTAWYMSIKSHCHKANGHQNNQIICQWVKMPLLIRYGNSYIPYPYRCQTSGHCSPRPALAQPTEPPIASQRPPIAIPPCVHLRWNYELPFSELPNLVFSFLALDLVSGQTLTEKSR